MLNQDNFDFSKFTNKELKFFTKYGIKELLKKENENLSRLVKEYVDSKLPKENVVKAYFEHINENNVENK